MRLARSLASSMVGRVTAGVLVLAAAVFGFAGLGSGGGVESNPESLAAATGGAPAHTIHRSAPSAIEPAVRNLSMPAGDCTGGSCDSDIPLDLAALNLPPFSGTSFVSSNAAVVSTDQADATATFGTVAVLAQDEVDPADDDGGVPDEADACEVVGCAIVETPDELEKNLPSPAVDGIENAKTLRELAQQNGNDVDEVDVLQDEIDLADDDGGVPDDADACEVVGCDTVETPDGLTKNLPLPAVDGINRAKELRAAAQANGQGEEGELPE